MIFSISRISFITKNLQSSHAKECSSISRRSSCAMEAKKCPNNSYYTSQQADGGQMSTNVWWQPFYATWQPSFPSPCAFPGTLLAVRNAWSIARVLFSISCSDPKRPRWTHRIHRIQKLNNSRHGRRLVEASDGEAAASDTKKCQDPQKKHVIGKGQELQVYLSTCIYSWPKYPQIKMLQAECRRCLSFVRLHAIGIPMAS